MTRGEVLDKAKEIVNGQRQREYGKAENNFETIGNYWSHYLWSKYGECLDRSLSAEDVANMMILLKVARLSSGKGTDDCYIDIAGYAACGCEVHGI